MNNNDDFKKGMKVIKLHEEILFNTSILLNYLNLYLIILICTHYDVI